MLIYAILYMDFLKRLHTALMEFLAGIEEPMHKQYKSTYPVLSWNSYNDKDGPLENQRKKLKDDRNST